MTGSICTINRESSGRRDSHLYDMCQCAQSDLAREDYSTEWITRQAQEEIERWKEGEPSMLMVGYITPHHPFDPPAPYSTM